MSDRSLIFNAKGAQIGYIEGSRAFDLRGRERCNYARTTGNLTDLTGEKIVGYISLDGTFVGLSWISDELFGKPSGEAHSNRALAKKRQKAADEVPLPDPEPTVSGQNSTKASSAPDELVDRAIGMIRTALGNGSDAAAPA
jgi:hypothetical protein